MLEYDVSVDFSNFERGRFEVHLEMDKLEYSAVEAIRKSKHATEDSLLFLHHQDGIERHCLQTLDDVPGFKSPSVYPSLRVVIQDEVTLVSPYAMSKTFRFPPKEQRPCDIVSYLELMNESPFRNLNIAREAEKITGLGKQRLWFTAYLDWAVGEFHKPNNIGFNSAAYATGAQTKKELFHHLMRTLLHELNHAYEDSINLGVRSAWPDSDHLAEYFCLRAYNEAPWLVSLYTPAVKVLTDNAEDRKCFDFDPSTGNISEVLNPAVSPFEIKMKAKWKKEPLKPRELEIADTLSARIKDLMI